MEQLALHPGMALLWLVGDDLLPFFTIGTTPKTDFIISGFSRWLVVHMWVEVTCEIFTAVIVARLYRETDFASKAKAERST